MLNIYSGGYYCTSGATRHDPNNPATGGRCLAGSYCPEGSSAPIDCDGGMYCNSDYMIAPAGNCTVGK